MSVQLVNLQGNERVDLTDLLFGLQNSIDAAQRSLAKIMVTGGGSYVLSGFGITGVGGSSILIAPGTIIMGSRNANGTDDSLPFTTANSKGIGISSFADGTYNVYIRAVYNSTDTQSRIFWNSAALQEFGQSIATRQTADWTAVVALSQPSTEYLLIGTVTIASHLVSSISGTRPFLFEGAESNSFQSTWGTGLHDRDTDRVTYGVTNLAVWTDAMRAQLSHLYGGGWYKADVNITSGTTNTPAVTATGNGTAAGVFGTGGATGPGVKGTGGASGGVGGLFTGTGGNAGVTSTGQGAGPGVFGTGGASSGPGVRGDGGATGGVGVLGNGAGAGAGGSFTGGSTGAGVVGTGGATSGDGGTFTATAGNSNGVTATAIGTGAGISASAVSTGVGGAFTSVNGAAVTGTATVGYGGKFTGGTGNAALNCVAQSQPGSQLSGDIYLDSADKSFFFVDASAIVTRLRRTLVHFRGGSPQTIGTTSATAINNGAATIPANSIKANDTLIRLAFDLNISRPGSATAVNLGFTLGGTTVTFLAIGSGTTSGRVRLVVDILFSSIGVSGTFDYTATLLSDTTIGATSQSYTSVISAGTMDTTALKQVQAAIQFPTTTNNTVTVLNSTIEII